MWSLIVAIVVGFFAGLIARALHPRDDKAGFIVTTLLVSGSLLATYGGRLLEPIRRNSAAGFIASVIGAVIVLFIYNLVSKKPKTV